MFYKTLSKDKWQRLGLTKRAGVVVPLFSVYSKGSYGIGDFNDLKLLVDWALKSGNSIVQLLPMNEVGAEFCPYDSLSSFALEPMYLSLDEFFSLAPKALHKKFSDIKKHFPVKSDFIDYRIKKAKIDLLSDIFLDSSAPVIDELEEFKKKNSYWLYDFATFKALKEFHKGLPWYEWELKFRNRDKSSIEDFCRYHKEKIDFQIWLQWHAFKQFREVKSYAASKNVFLKGDLPILVSRDSADVWAHPEYFKLDLVAGAPPDMYCVKGQRWGMHTYNWDRIRNDSYEYLKEKLKYAENFYDIIRIDHVVGIFRIWSIHNDEPLENHGLNGFFDPSDRAKWGPQGKEILSFMVSNTSMLLCAEDLGVIPEECTKTLEELGIPGNDVQRWVKDWKIRHNFLEPHEYRELAVSMLSTHDTANWPAWWEYEAGTVDGGLFIRKCNERGIDYAFVKELLFDSKLSCHGRLRWRIDIQNSDALLRILNRPKEEVGDFIELYENTFKEKEKLWVLMGLPGPMREKSDKEIFESALKITLKSSSVFSIQTIFDLLYLADILKGDTYQYRINTPGTIGPENWRLVIPLTLEELLKHSLTDTIYSLVKSSQRLSGIKKF